MTTLQRIQTQLSLAVLGIESMTGETFVRKNRANVAIE